MKMQSLVPHMRPTDFPRNATKTAFPLKQGIVRQFNYARQHPGQMDALKNDLAFVLKRIAEWDQEFDKLKLEAVANGVELSTFDQKDPRLIMTGGNIRNIQSARATTVVNNKVVPDRPIATQEALFTGAASVAATAPGVTQRPAAVVRPPKRNVGQQREGHIRISRDGDTELVDQSGKVRDAAERQSVPTQGAVPSVTLPSAMQVAMGAAVPTAATQATQAPQLGALPLPLPLPKA